MGAEQSSHSTAQDAPPTKTCYYEVLEVDRQATDDEIKKAYRKKALELHPDRNYGDVENATIKFAEVQSAYQVLSDPQERAWYDSHRDSILRGDSGGPSDEDQYEHKVHITSARDIVGLISRFNPRMPFTDAPIGFYGILQNTFEKLANEEDAACDWEGLEPVDYPGFGSSTDDYEDAVKPFYRVWINFSTKKTFSWRDEYRASDAPDRATRRLIEKENKRLRDEGIREFNDAVRALVAFVRKRDPRFVPNSQTEADRQKILREAAAAQAARSRAANKAKLEKHVVSDWAKTNPPEEEAEFSSDESEVEHIKCVICNKTFKSEKQYETHEKSKKHLKAVQQLQRDMKRENKRLNLDGASNDEPLTPAEEFENLTVTEEEPYIVEPSSGPAQANGGRTGASNPNIASEPGEHFDHDIVEKEASSDDSPESDDEYAPRQDVEGRLASTLVGADDIKDIQLEEPAPTTTATSIASNDDSSKQPKLGKAKAKRAKKQARQEADTQGSPEFTCAACNNTFSSKTKLFNHIKDNPNHAQPVPKETKGKNKKR